MVTRKARISLIFRPRRSMFAPLFCRFAAMRHIISVLLANEAGALSRVAGLFSARGYNIESLTVAPTQTPAVSRLTLVTTGSDDVIEQINKQLKKLVDVVDLADWTEAEHIEREVMLLKMSVDVADVDQVAEIAGRYGAQVLDDQAASLTLEMTGTGSELDEFRAQITSHGEIVELVRSGATAIGIADQTLKLHG